MDDGPKGKVSLLYNFVWLFIAMCSWNQIIDVVKWKKNILLSLGYGAPYGYSAAAPAYGMYAVILDCDF